MTRKRHAEPYSARIYSGGKGAILATLFRKILIDLDVSVNRYNALMENYLRRSHQTRNRLIKDHARQGLHDELMKGSITWKTFLKGIDFLNFPSFTMKFRLEIKGGITATISKKSGDDGIDDPGAFLGSFAKEIRDALLVDREALQVLLEKHLDRQGLTDAKERAAMKASLNKDLAKTKMTWSTFIKQFFILEVTSFTVAMYLTHALQKKTTVHDVVVSLNEYDDTDDES